MGVVQPQPASPEVELEPWEKERTYPQPKGGRPFKIPAGWKASFKEWMAMDMDASRGCALRPSATTQSLCPRQSRTTWWRPRTIRSPRQPAHTQLECIGERVKPAAAAQGETDEEKLERVRKAVSDDIVNKGERVELMGDFDAFVAAVKAEAAVKEFPQKNRQKLRNNWTQLERRRAKNVQKMDGK